jgi:hypothetical protein
MRGNVALRRGRFAACGMIDGTMTAVTFHERPRALFRDFVAEVGRSLVRWLLLGLGGVLVVLGVLMAPLPGPLGLPVTLAGLVLILRNSFRLRRVFIKVQRRHPRFVFPLRRLLRRDPEIAAVAWQQALRLEKVFLPKSWRMGKQLRRKYFRR